MIAGSALLGPREPSTNNFRVGRGLPAEVVLLRRERRPAEVELRRASAGSMMVRPVFDRGSMMVRPVFDRGSMMVGSTGFGDVRS
jgi:hypothetical protein